MDFKELSGVLWRLTELIRSSDARSRRNLELELFIFQDLLIFLKSCLSLHTHQNCMFIYIYIYIYDRLYNHVDCSRTNEYVAKFEVEFR